MGLADGLGRRSSLFDLDRNRSAFVASLRSPRLYDFASTGAKKPTDAKLSSRDYEMLGVGREFGKLGGKIGTVFQFDDDMYKDITYTDHAGNTVTKRELDKSHPDVFVDTETGQTINMRALDRLRLQQINMPSMQNDSDILTREMLGLAYANGGDRATTGAVSRAIAHWGSGKYSGAKSLEGLGEAGRRQAVAQSQTLLDFLTGRMLISSEEEAGMKQLNQETQAEIDRIITGLGEDFVFTNPYTGKPYAAGDDSKRAYRKQLERNAGLVVSRNALREFGPTEQRVSELFGQEKLEAEQGIQGQRFYNEELASAAQRRAEAQAVIIEEQQAKRARKEHRSTRKQSAPKEPEDDSH